MLRFFVHYGIHFLVPVLIAYLFYRKKFKQSTLILLSAIIIDIDHLLASPIFDANRCSINYHFLHTYWAIAVYFFMLIPKKTRLIGIGLLIHILADTADCILMRL